MSYYLLDLKQERLYNSLFSYFFSHTSQSLTLCEESFLGEFFHHSQKTVMSVVTSNLKENRLFQKMNQPILKRLLHKDHFILLHFSSFQEMKVGNWPMAKIKKNYWFIPLPLDFKSFTELMLKADFSLSDEEKNWPGGKKSRPMGLIREMKSGKL